MTQAKLLSQAPLSGTIDEARFNATGTCTWIEFEDDTYNNWCGIFGHGIQTGQSAVTINKIGQSFIISQGQGYLIDVNSRKLLHQTENDWLISVIAIADSDYFVACTYTNIYAYSPNGLLWVSDRVSFDGIELNTVKNKIVPGKVWDLENWIDFSLKIDGWVYQSEFKCDWK